MPAKVVMYTRDYCGYCSAAERLLAGKGITYEHINATNKPDVRKWLAETTGRSTVPQIFIDDRPIGGYDDLRALDRRGELDKLIAGGAA